MTVLYLSALLYALGTGTVLASLYNRSQRLQRIALSLMIGGFFAHTVWIGIICTRTNHPPLTNLPEAAAFIGWTLFVVELLLLFRYRVHAASLFIYPMVLMLLSISVFVTEPFMRLPKAEQSTIFTLHLLLSSVGIAALLIGTAFVVLYQIQQRELKTKQSSRVAEWIPSLQVCERVSYGALAVGFVIYTAGILAGFLWSYQRTAGALEPGAKEFGALVAWLLFAVVLQSYINGSYRARKAVVLSLCGFIALLVSIFGISRV